MFRNSPGQRGNATRARGAGTPPREHWWGWDFIAQQPHGSSHASTNACSTQLSCFALQINLKKSKPAPEPLFPAPAELMHSSASLRRAGFGFHLCTVCWVKGILDGSGILPLVTLTRQDFLAEGQGSGCPRSPPGLCRHWRWPRRQPRLAGSSSSTTQEKIKCPPSRKASGYFLQGRRDHSWRRGNKTNQRQTTILLSFTTPLTCDALLTRAGGFPSALPPGDATADQAQKQRWRVRRTQAGFRAANLIEPEKTPYGRVQPEPCSPSTGPHDLGRSYKPSQPPANKRSVETELRPTHSILLSSSNGTTSLIFCPKRTSPMQPSPTCQPYRRVSACRGQPFGPLRCKSNESHTRFIQAPCEITSSTSELPWSSLPPPATAEKCYGKNHGG